MQAAMKITGIGGGGQGVAYKQESHQNWEEPWAFKTFSGADVTQSPHLTPHWDSSARWRFLLFIVLKYTTQNYHLNHF